MSKSSTNDGEKSKGPPPGERTFQNQDQLPSLPVPDLRKTLEKYLDSVSIHLSPIDFERTKRIVDQFECGIGQKLHKLLVERAKEKRNWLEEWWEAYGYHIPRYPIMPLVNFGGASPFYEQWPPTYGVEIERSALSTYWMLRYWDMVRKEELAPQHQRGTRWCMNQVHRLFNTCRIPGETKDHLKFSFKSVYEGTCPSHIVVADRGLYWRLDILDSSTGEVLSPPQLEAALKEIREAAGQLTGVPIGALTCLERTEWYKERQHLISLSPENLRNLNTIEDAVFMLSYTNEEPKSDAELAFQMVCSHPYVSWADKNIVWEMHKNGLMTSNCDHSYLDAIVVIQMNSFVDERLLKDGFRWNGSPRSDGYVRPTQLKFVTDSRTIAAIGRALDTWSAYANDYDVVLWHFSGFGNDFCKKHKIYGDTVVQLAMQLAYLRLHSRPGATYETATTKKYFHGRTETVRSCTPEAIDWAKSMLCADTKGANRRQKFDRALEKHNRLMVEAMNGEGCDRHLFGLKTMAQERGLPIPDIFTDPAWRNSGGDGYFVVSSSFTGYSNVVGGVAAMCADGYGTFYKIEPKRITFYMTAWKSSKETNVALWRDNLEFALTAINDLLEKSAQVSKY